MHVIGEDTAERLDVIPAQYRLIVTHRPQYACRTCEQGVVQAPAPERLIKGGLPTEDRGDGGLFPGCQICLAFAALSRAVVLCRGVCRRERLLRILQRQRRSSSESTRRGPRIA